MSREDDVIALAKAVSDNFSYYWCQNGGSYSEYNECIFCGNNVYSDEDPSKILHKSNCAVLVARDLLTGVKIE